MSTDDRRGPDYRPAPPRPPGSEGPPLIAVRQEPVSEQPDQRIRALTIAVVVVLVLDLIAAFGVLRTWQGKRAESQPGRPPAATSSPTSTRVFPTNTPTATPTGTITAASPVVPGWKSVVAVKEQVAYDVPPDWTILPPTTEPEVRGGAGKTSRVHAAAAYRPGGCPVPVDPSFPMARAGFVPSPSTNASAASLLVLQDWVDTVTWDEAGATRLQPTDSQAAEATTPGGTDVFVAGALVPLKSSGCKATGLRLIVAAFEAHGSIAVFVLWRYEGGEAPLPKQTAEQIVMTLRPLA